MFDKRNPETRVYEFSTETENEPDFDKAVMFFEAKKQMRFKLKCGKMYEEITGEKYKGASFFKLAAEKEEK